jgi:hypothetical protein
MLLTDWQGCCYTSSDLTNAGLQAAKVPSYCPHTRPHIWSAGSGHAAPAVRALLNRHYDRQTAKLQCYYHAGLGYDMHTCGGGSRKPRSGLVWRCKKLPGTPPPPRHTCVSATAHRIYCSGVTHTPSILPTLSSPQEWERARPASSPDMGAIRTQNSTQRHMQGAHTHKGTTTTHRSQCTGRYSYGQRLQGLQPAVNVPKAK